MIEVCKEQCGPAPGPVGPVESWRLRSGAVTAESLSLGCGTKSLSTPDRSGQSADIVLGYDDLEGEVKPVEKTLFDLRKLVLLGSRLEELPGPGFYHNFSLFTCRVVHPGTGRVLEVSTTQPGVQFYTSNFLDGTLKGKGGAAYSKHSAFCLETQKCPDAVNQVTELKVHFNSDKTKRWHMIMQSLRSVRFYF
uniref:Galactose mutarotase n=1 Tax=Sinocyclocheilus grahami TaxID=75366 RepID=A0A672N234_SINGR